MSIHIYVYIYICVCVCIYISIYDRQWQYDKYVHKNPLCSNLHGKLKELYGIEVVKNQLRSDGSHIKKDLENPNVQWTAVYEK